MFRPKTITGGSARPGPMVSHQTTLRVRWSEADPAGIVFYPRIFEWFDMASDELFRAVGLPWEELFPHERIVGLPILEAECRFRAPIRYGDQVTIVSTITEIKDTTFRVDHEVKVGEAACASGHELRAWAQSNQGGALQARPIPDTIVERLGGEGAPRAGPSTGQAEE